MNENKELLAASLEIADGKSAELDCTALAGLSGADGNMADTLHNIAHIADFYRQAHNPLGNDTGGRQQWGQLELREVLGRGSYGMVYRALDPTLQREIALKLLPAGEDDSAGPAADQALSEARRLASLKHANVVTIFSAERQEGQVGLSMELIDGYTLADIVSRQGPLGAVEATRIGSDLCRALTAIHAAGLVHRDIKPANVMRERGGRVVLMDLGTSVAAEKVAGQESDGPQLQGTPLFAAPEILRGNQSDTAGDIYSLGALLDHLVSGSYPIQAATLPELIARLDSDELVSLRERRPDLDQGFIAVVEKAMASDPTRRFGSMAEFERALASWGGGGSTAGEVKKPGLGKLVRGLIALSIVVALSGGLWWQIMGGSEPVGYQANAELMLGTANPPRLLSPGSLVVTGDRLFMNFTGSRQLYVYLINEDDQGEAFVLFPLPGMDLGNPLSGGTHRLPPARDGVPFSWGVSSAGGQEHFLIVASPEPVPILEELLVSLPIAEQVSEQATPALPIPAATVRRLRGVGVLLAEPGATTVGAADGAIARVQKQLQAGMSGEDELWVKRIDLANPR